MSPPPLPTLQNDTALVIFAHSFVRSPEQNDRADRLAFLGGKVLHMVTAETLEKKSTLNTVDLIGEFEKMLSNDGKFYEQWVSFYKLREKVACPYALRGELEEPGTTQQLFDTYVGAAYVEQGYPKTKAWIQSLVDPDSVSTSVGGSSMGTSTDNPPPPTTSPPPLPNNSTGAGSFLAKFNETAMRHRANVIWNAASSGSSAHLPTWMVDCVVDGTVKGAGVGKNKQQAKEEAARQAYQALGWGRSA